MIKNNLLLEKLAEKVRSHNEDVNRNLQSVAVWQNFITIMYVVFTIVVFIISDRLLVGKTIVSGINSNVISLIITIVLLLKLTIITGAPVTAWVWLCMLNGKQKHRLIRLTG